MRFENQVPARTKHRQDENAADFACWRCGWKLASALFLPHSVAVLYKGAQWLFQVPPGFTVASDGVVRPTKKRRRAWRTLRRKAETSVLARKRLQSGSQAFLPDRDLVATERGVLMQAPLPALMECESCHAINRLEPPR